MSYRWPGIPNGDYSVDHGRALWNKIINYLRRLSEQLDEDLVGASPDRQGMVTVSETNKPGCVPIADSNGDLNITITGGAVSDGNGNVITDTYATKTDAIVGLSASGTTVTYTKGDGTTGTITTQDTTYSVATSEADGLMSAADKASYDILQQNITTTPASGKIPLAGIDGKIADGWLPTSVLRDPGSGSEYMVLMRTASGYKWEYLADILVHANG